MMVVGRDLVIAVGNPLRGDDGVGCVVLDRLRTVLAGRDPVVELRRESGEGTSLMDAWEGRGRVIVIDAVESGAAPGTIHRIDAAEREVPTEFFHYSTHAFSVAEAVEMARVLGRLPRRLVLYGVEGGSFAAGEGLSAPVAAAAGELAGKILEELSHA